MVLTDCSGFLFAHEQRGSKQNGRLAPSIVAWFNPGYKLSHIARNFGTTVDALMAANGLTSTQITVGQVLKIP